MATPDVASGNAGGLMAFMDFMVDKGYAKASSINPWKTAAKQVFSTVEGDDFANVDVRNLDVEEYLSRFENRSLGKYAADSLAAYRSRFRKAIDAYQSYLKDPNWKPATRSRPTSVANPASGRRGRSAVEGRYVSRDSSATGGELGGTPSAAPAGPSLMAYPFPLKSGQMAQLHLPTRLDGDDAERLIHFIRALVFEQPRQLSPGQSGEGAPDE